MPALAGGGLFDLDAQGAGAEVARWARRVVMVNLGHRHRNLKCTVTVIPCGEGVGGRGTQRNLSRSGYRRKRNHGSETVEDFVLRFSAAVESKLIGISHTNVIMKAPKTITVI